ncbi:hypothetical protein [Leptobacterium sp. I13]|uniref:hypothetical protein n=1 Tax=Leptobacterium meishanense TaxID=3128904 RepID=UPI0030ED3AED
MISKVDNIKNFIETYENNISSKRGSIDDYINLILLYWNISFDYGIESYCITHNIFTKEDIQIFPSKSETLLNDSLKKYPKNKELLFWKMYIEELNSYSYCIYKDEILRLIQDSEFLLPYFYLKVQCNIINEKELKKLKLTLLSERDSYKKEYILSYLKDVRTS